MAILDDFNAALAANHAALQKFIQDVTALIAAQNDPAMDAALQTAIASLQSDTQSITTEDATVYSDLPPAGVTITPATANLIVGGTLPVNAVATDASGVPLRVQPTFTWTTTANAVATASPASASSTGSGTVTAQGVGTATVSASVTGGVSGHVAVTVVSTVFRYLCHAASRRDGVTHNHGI